MYFHINQNGLLILFDVFSVPHRERDRESPQNQPVGLIMPESLMYATAVLKRKSIQSPPPPASAATPQGLIDVPDGEAGIPAFCSFKEEPRRRSEGDFRESDR